MDIIQLAGLNLVKLLLHVGGKLVVRNRLKLIYQQAGHTLAERRRTQRLVLLGHIVAVEDGRDRRRIGRRATDAALLHCTDKRRFGIACGRLGEVLCGVELLDRQRIPLVKARQRFARVALLFVVRAFLVHCGKAGECDRVAGCAKHLSLAHDIGRHRVEQCIRHLAGDKTRPDQLIQLVLVGRQVLTDFVRQQFDIRRPDGFVRVLRVSLSFEHTRLARIVLLAVTPANKARSGGGRLVRQTQRVGTHVGDQTGQAILTQFNAFV